MWKGLTSSQRHHTGADTLFRLERKHQVSFHTESKFEHKLLYKSYNRFMKYGHDINTGMDIFYSLWVRESLSGTNIFPHKWSLT
jgi:hypothetical protein